MVHCKKRKWQAGNGPAGYFRSRLTIGKLAAVLRPVAVIPPVALALDLKRDGKGAVGRSSGSGSPGAGSCPGEVEK